MRTTYQIMMGLDDDRGVTCEDLLGAESPQSRGGCGVAGVASRDGRARRDVVTLALEAALAMEHRGGRVGDRADGSGILVRTPQAFFEQFIDPDRNIPEDEPIMVGDAWFLPDMSGDYLNLQKAIDQGIHSQGFEPLGWRKVPVNRSALPAEVREGAPRYWQILLGRGLISPSRIQRQMYLLRNTLGGSFRSVYFPCFVPGTIAYKNLCSPDRLVDVFPDLDDPLFSSSAAVAHRRYSTNTVPRFVLTQPFSLLCHNGEINTNRANVNAVSDLERALRLFFKVLMRQGSDSANLDRMVELFTSSGVPLAESLRRFMMPPWRDHHEIDDSLRQFYEGCRRALGNLAVMEGPSAVVAIDQETMVACLDKMGLRPLRYLETKDDLFIVSSELGAIGVEPKRIRSTGQLNPGQMIVLDAVAKRVRYPDEVESHIAQHSPANYRDLATRKILSPEPSALRYAFEGDIAKRLGFFGWDPSRKIAVRKMLRDGQEPIQSMGYGRPLAMLFDQPVGLFKYFKQIVAVVTNPPIDPLRERGAFDLTTYLGRRPDISGVRPDYVIHPQYRLESPLLTDSELASMRANSTDPAFPKIVRLKTLFKPGSVDHLTTTLSKLAETAHAVAREGRAEILVLSDRDAHAESLPLPSILTVAFINKTLRDNGLRRRISLVVDTGEVQEAHDAAVLFAHGADAINPFMMWHVAYEQGHAPESDEVARLRWVLDSGIRRIMSKMGITTLDGYRDSQLFEVVGINPTISAYYLGGTPSFLGGIGIEEIYQAIVRRTAPKTSAKNRRSRLKPVYRKDVYMALQRVARGEESDAYARYVEEVGKTPKTYLRDLLDLRFEQEPVDTDDVASVDEIVSTVFRGAALSHGALNKWAHMAIARAFNTFGSRSNCGEGGEDRARDRGGPLEKTRSRIRQIASGRFGVNAAYLANADEIQIKIGQGAKPGEGGHLPAHKVTDDIAAIRGTRPGVALISPPPHHSIYSIEDLAQLVYNLRQINPEAIISVKVPAVTNLGTIAVGIVKADADIIEISCFSGGTGAAHASSIEHAGLPLERSLTEVHQVLTENGVREWVRLRADGGIKVGEEVAKIIALGADEVTFGSALMIAEMCVMCRGCSKGNCPAGIAAQTAEGMARFMSSSGQSEEDPMERYREAAGNVRKFLASVAGDLRAILGKLGLSHPAELRGRIDLLKTKKARSTDHYGLVDLRVLLRDVSAFDEEALPIEIRSRAAAKTGNGIANRRIVEGARNGKRVLESAVTIADRAVGTQLAGLIASRQVAVPDGGFEIILEGYAGQALGFGATSGMVIQLTGYANDSVGEAMSGDAEISIRQPPAVSGERSKNSVVGNAAGYGATGGFLWVEGSAGQRLGVRNSGATIVAEGCGKYAFEYMTGGVGVLLGAVSEVVGAGMTGGVIYSRDARLETTIHAPSVEVRDLTEMDRQTLHRLIARFAEKTNSRLARELLQEWNVRSSEFRAIHPHINSDDDAHRPR